MKTPIQVTGRTLVIEQITHAIVFPNQTHVFPVDYHELILMGDDGKQAAEALRAAGFVGDHMLINPQRVSVIEDQGSTVRVFLEGADKILHLPKEIVAALFPVQETAPGILAEPGVLAATTEAEKRPASRGKKASE